MSVNVARQQGLTTEVDNLRLTGYHNLPHASDRLDAIFSHHDDPTLECVTRLIHGDHASIDKCNQALGSVGLNAKTEIGNLCGFGGGGPQ